MTANFEPGFFFVGEVRPSDHSHHGLGRRFPSAATMHEDPNQGYFPLPLPSWLMASERVQDESTPLLTSTCIEVRLD